MKLVAYVQGNKSQQRRLIADIMDETTISNQQKYLNYREQFKRLNKALANEFNLEAMFIEYPPCYPNQSEFLN